MAAPGSWRAGGRSSAPAHPRGLGLGGGGGGTHPTPSPRVAQTAPWDPLPPQGWGEVPAGPSPSGGGSQKDVGRVMCPGTHPAHRRQLLPRGMRGPDGGESRVPVLAARARREPGQCCPRYPIGMGLGSAPGTRGPPLGTCGQSVPPSTCPETSRSPRDGLSPGEVGGGSPLAPGCPEHPTGCHRKDVTASPNCSILACPLGPGLHRSPQAHPILCQPRLGITAPSWPSFGVGTLGHPPPSPLPWDTAEEGTGMGMGTGLGAAFTWG